MRGIVKTANRFDSVWAMVVMFPAAVVLMNAAIAVHQGNASTGDLAGAAQGVAEQVAGQYTPYIETTAGGILAGVEKLSKTAASCLSGSHGPVYLKSGMVHRNGCAISSTFSSGPRIRPYRGY